MREKEEEEETEEETGGKAEAGTQMPCMRPATSAPVSPSLVTVLLKPRLLGFRGS